MIDYRDAGASDLTAVDLLFRASFTATFGDLYAPTDLAAFFARFSLEAWAAELAREDVAIRLAEGDGALIGFAKVSAPTLPVEPAGVAIELRQLYLAEAGKGTGIADALLAWTIDYARERHAGEIFLSVYIDNHRARRFYRRHGFVEIGRYTFMVGNHQDNDRIMRLTL